MRRSQTERNQVVIYDHAALDDSSMFDVAPVLVQQDSPPADTHESTVIVSRQHSNVIENSRRRQRVQRDN